MNELKVFGYRDQGSIRALEIDGQPWFVGKDVAEILGYENGSRDINRHVDNEDRQNYRNGTSEINNRGMTIINESGLYSLILSSKLPKAKEFKRWVTSEVLPSIRQTGNYFKGNEMDFVIKTVTESIIKQLPAIVAETVKSILKCLPESKENLRLNPLDWNEAAFWENVLSDWRSFRGNYANKEQADRDFIKNINEQYPNMRIGRRTLYRKWHDFTAGGSTALIDKRGRHGNHKKKVIVTVEIEESQEIDIER